MTAEDLARIEKDLSVTLTPAFRAALERPEFQSESAGFAEFSGDADEIIGLNLDVWEEGFGGVKWPEHFLVIGEDGAGNLYFTDLQRERPAVFLADHERTPGQPRVVTSETYETFADFLAFLHRLQAEPEPESESESDSETGAEPPLAGAAAKKPWWRFW